MSRSEQVGQLLMVAVSSSGMDPSEEAMVDRTRAGSVLLLGNSTAGMQAIRGVVSHVRDAARSENVESCSRRTRRVGWLRLKGPGFTTIPSATVKPSSLMPGFAGTPTTGPPAQVGRDRPSPTSCQPRWSG